MDNLLLQTIEHFFDDNIQYEDITILSNTSAIIYQLFPDINWVGFYLYIDGILKLGPFQGKPACMHIPLDKGVCGYCASRLESIVVDNIHNFEGHIACDSESNSELVVPIIINAKLYGLLDIDSKSFNRFSSDDLVVFEKIIKVISKYLNRKKIKRL